jgi:dTDP-4-dehydrorhamnose reductase
MILLTGGTGQLGSAIRRAAGARGIDVVAPARRQLDVRDSGVRTLHALRPGVVIHCAAQTDSVACHEDPAGAFAINAAGALNVARACADVGAVMVLVSTDAVFDGTLRPSPYSEEDIPHSPVNVYGASKLAAEHLVVRTCAALVVRIGWLFTDDPWTDRKLVGVLVRRSQAGQRVRAVTDRWGSPSFAPHIAGRLLDYATTGVEGVRHLTNRGVTTRYSLTSRLLAALAFPAVEPATSDEFPDPVERPVYSGLTTRYADAILPEWQAAVDELAAALRRPSPA